MAAPPADDLVFMGEGAGAEGAGWGDGGGYGYGGGWGEGGAGAEGAAAGGTAVAGGVTSPRPAGRGMKRKAPPADDGGTTLDAAARDGGFEGGGRRPGRASVRARVPPHPPPPTPSHPPLSLSDAAGLDDRPLPHTCPRRAASQGGVACRRAQGWGRHTGMCTPGRPAPPALPAGGTVGARVAGTAGRARPGAGCVARAGGVGGRVGRGAQVARRHGPTLPTLCSTSISVNKPCAPRPAQPPGTPAPRPAAVRRARGDAPVPVPAPAPAGDGFCAGFGDGGGGFGADGFWDGGGAWCGDGDARPGGLPHFTDAPPDVERLRAALLNPDAAAAAGGLSPGSSLGLRRSGAAGPAGSGKASSGERPPSQGDDR